MASEASSVSSPSEVPIMEVFKEIEELSVQDDLEDQGEDEKDDLPDTIKMTMENADDSNEPIDFHCEAVKKDDGSVQYECRFVQQNGGGGNGNEEAKCCPKTNKDFPRVTGKFSLNVP